MNTKTATSGFRRSDRAASLQLSEIVQISEAVRRLQRAGHDVLSFGTGEPDFATPSHVVQAAHDAALRGDTGYTPTQGTPQLREAIAKDAATQSNFSPDAAEIIVSTGAKQVLSNAFLATLNPGDQVIVPAPYWTSYPDMITFCQAEMVAVQCAARDNLKLTAQGLRQALTTKTRWIMLNNPGNPSGALYAPDELAALADELRAHPDVWIMCDEIYQHIAFEEFVSFRAVAPDLASRTLIVNGVSKAYAMTGWRIGWGIGPKELIRAMAAIQGQSTSGASSISQAAAVAALSGPQGLLSERCAEFRARRDFVVAALNATPRLNCPVPGGAFYVFASCAECVGLQTPAGDTIDDDANFCRYILDSAHVGLVPGRAFGLPGHFRLSYAYAMPDLTEGCARIVQAVAALSKKGNI